MKSVLPVEIPKRSKSCFLGQEIFQPGMEYYSILMENQDNDLERKDFCLACWETAKETEAFKSIWKAKVATKEEKIRFQNRDEKILYLFRQLNQEDDEISMMEFYVLSLYLMRRKILFHREEITQDHLVKIVYEINATEEMILVRKFDLSVEQISLIQLRIAEKL